MHLGVIVRDTAVWVEVHEVVVGLASALSEVEDSGAGVPDQPGVVRAVLDGGR